MKIKADLNTGKLYMPDAVYQVSNKIRTIRNGTRKSYEVVRTIPGGYPYDPRPFPKGLWRITAVEWQREKGFDRRTYGPVKIRTNAHCPVNVWALDGEGDYLEETGRTDRDTGYLLHYSDSGTTLGCIRLDSPEDAVAIANAIAEAMKDGTVEMEVC